MAFQSTCTRGACPPDFLMTELHPTPSVLALNNGVRVLVLPCPGRETVDVSVFVRSGSLHESKATNGISHFVEHMAFKGTATRDCQRINLDAERLGAEVNAHTDKDHTAFHMAGLRQHVGTLVQMLGDIVRHSTFPEAELERERQVILHEYADDEEDALSAAFTLFDKTCFGDHPAAWPVIGTRRSIERVTRQDLLGYVQRQYSGANVVLCVAGDVNADRVAADAEAALGSMPAGRPNTVPPPVHVGGVAAKRLAGSGQTHIAFGYPIPALHGAYHASVVAAAVFGEGMSSPLLDEIRERRGLVYHASCSADVMEQHGQFVIEASTAPEQAEEFFVEVTRLLRAHAGSVGPVDLERARNQIAVRTLRTLERPMRRLEASALDLFALGRLRSHDDYMARISAVTREDARAAFEQMLRAPAAVAMAGKVGKGLPERVRELVGE